MSIYRTPSSLNWLLEKRRRIAGQIQLIEKKLAYFAGKYPAAKVVVDQHDVHMPRLLRALKSDLKALDQTIGLHQIPIDPELTSPIRERRLKPHYGNMTRTINACFAENLLEWKTTTELAAY